MNAARLHNSQRLLRTLAVLVDCQEHSTREIIATAHVCAVNSIVSEIRANGIAVQCRRRGRHYYYRIGLDKPGRPCP